MPNDTEIKEYISNDVGKIWVGTYESFDSLSWIYGQFDKDVLPSICVLLERSDLMPKDRGNVVLMSRAISAIVITEFRIQIKIYLM